jgi:hypothetical protein
LSVSADTVWKVVGGFNALPDWHPAVEESEIKDGGLQRKLRLVGGGSLTETLDEHDDSQRTYSYSIVNGTLPLANYRSTIKVSEEGEDCRIEWSSRFDPFGVSATEAENLIENIYKTGFENLKKLLGA